jgi:hypothetical protein
VAGGQPQPDSPAAAGGQPGDPAASAGQPEPWFANVAEDGRSAGEQAGTPAGDGPPAGGPAAGNGALAGDEATAAAQPVAHWAWLSIAAMTVPLAVLLLVVLV